MHVNKKSFQKKSMKTNKMFDIQPVDIVWSPIKCIFIFVWKKNKDWQSKLTQDCTTAVRQA